ncbi:2OG-Fe(II) oxygenase [Dyadobacter sp. CY356]|uniref:2OG-Fe(II) oxygenase n=1 Tax=Dyadobacter sp. CY356 TaxID=2906442 RepID=UPI001F262D30|nr:2OG-Fe(II) oxygenase [Dyadobacter sp. CY356]MCF0055570.1 2OG-Fe(II) oxygenase [Dyadobacter sp. CY356]
MAYYKNLELIDWNIVTESIHQRGYCLLPKMVDDDNCNELVSNYGKSAFYRKTIVMERCRFGLGEYKYFQYPLPELIQSIREGIYPKLAAIANKWMQVLNINKIFPDSFEELQQQCHDNNQTKPTVLILKYGKGGFNTLHQDLYGEIFFPMQLVIFLNEPGIDYSGGEFVLVQQTPRAQSKAIVLKPKKGDILIFTTNFRPVKGSKGYYRANMKHGVSEILEGNRYTLGIIFHDALS